MRVLITGADGFVGRHLSDFLLKNGDDVLALAGPGGESFGRVVDILDARVLEEAVRGFSPDAVVNLAGVSSVSRSHSEPVETFRVNALGVVNVCATLRAAAPKTRLLLVGSGEMYGPVVPGSAAVETAPLLPNSPYAAAKVGAEMAAFAFHRAYGLSVIAARPFNHLGRGQAPAFVVPSFARQIEAIRARGGGGVIAVGNLDPVRDFSHVRDVVAAYRILLERGVPGEVYNVSSGVGRTIRSILEEMVTLSGIDARIEVDPARVRPVELPSLVGDPSKLKALGWAPKHNVHEALEDALREARG
jgi:GDP-4-dehydro-6-deoxy-D-mannose reductase